MKRPRASSDELRRAFSAYRGHRTAQSGLDGLAGIRFVAAWWRRCSPRADRAADGARNGAATHMVSRFGCGSIPRGVWPGARERVG